MNKNFLSICVGCPYFRYFFECSKVCEQYKEEINLIERLQIGL